MLSHKGGFPHDNSFSDWLPHDDGFPYDNWLWNGLRLDVDEEDLAGEGVEGELALVLAQTEGVVEAEVGVVSLDPAEPVAGGQSRWHGLSHQRVHVAEGLEVSPLMIGGSEVEHELAVFDTVAVVALVDGYLVAHFPLADDEDDEDDELALAHSHDLLQLCVPREGPAEGLAHEGEEIILFGGGELVSYSHHLFLNLNY